MSACQKQLVVQLVTVAAAAIAVALFPSAMTPTTTVLLLLTVVAALALSAQRRFQQAARVASDARRLKTELLANVSHELRTPLNAILGWLQILQMAPVSEERLKQALKSWRGAIPATLGDHDVQVIEGLTESGLPVKLYFDDESGLLLRQVRYTETPIGRNSWQIDYDDYRSVGTSGVKMAFKWRVLWQSGDSTMELTDVQPNATVDAARFARPAAPPRPRTP